MTTLKDYAPSEVLVTFGGVTIGGFEEGTFITLSKNEDGFSNKSGINGDGIRIKKVNNFYTVTFTLLMTSESNDFLAAAFNADMAVTGAGLLPLTITGGGRDSFGTAEAWVIKPTDTNYSDAADAKAWTLGAFNPLYFPGGY